ncbi:CehA/McbA family metallohydrolase [Endozoicomonas sp. SM1973]|uniref:CehA/McbA family metallohydrolase n=1 Tax=Spartinivicinus marinus TaxID=2994442 RepID=A0A853I9B0_9GAMM|nr:CehA/McbA family metallohydrolase [Spartinivicinus marinus]MCX4026407.1 CehA/McbA family metallohydrolase [Spartinivicinus marinus]NYZ67248.1 CehA/McbA family metallohydrolase [Spartinivicinus marinus]
MNKKTTLTLATSLVLGGLASPFATADVSVKVGPTSIPQGNAVGKKDITIQNNKLAIAIAVETAPPWGVARGGIIDIATVKDGVIGSDKASLMDFIPNNWSSWPTTYQKVNVVKNTPKEAIITTDRDWEGVTLHTRYRLKANDNKVHVVTKMKNTTKKAYDKLLSGYVLWPDGGYLFGVPGMKGAKQGKATHALTDWMSAYDEDWSLGLHAPYFNFINYGSRDMYLSHQLQPGEERSFEGWLQVGPSGDLSPMVASEIKLKNLPAGTIQGSVVTTSGKTVEKPAIVVEKNGQPYTWVIGDKGKYSLRLPAGKYNVYATAKGHASSTPIEIELKKKHTVTQNFNDLQAPGELQVKVKSTSSGQPLDARITIEEGDKPLIKYFGKKTFFTNLHPTGQAKITIAPGKYKLKVAHAEGFLAKAKYYDISIKPESSQNLVAAISPQANPNASHWYSADLHHHSDVLDGFTPPEYVLRSQLAAGLDLSFLSDHDTAKNHYKMADLSRSRNVPFIPSMEISPSWGHFNAYPLQLGKPLTIDPGTASAKEVLTAAIELGASAIQANHPMIAYGYFKNTDNKKVPGGFHPNFELLEINSAVEYDKTIKRVWQQWNNGNRYYFSAGSDTHDVWNELSGKVRIYTQVNGEVTADSFVKAIKTGNAYVTFGPLIYPHQKLGEEIKTIPGAEVKLSFDVQAVHGLKSVKLIERGEVKNEKTFNNSQELTEVLFTVTPQQDSWFSLVVEDSQGKRAFTNPIWLKVINLAVNQQ